MKLATLYRLGGRMVPQSRAVISGVMRPSFPFFLASAVCSYSFGSGEH